MSIIVLENISFRYDENEAFVFRGFSLSVEAGECRIIEGDNGSGKTTLFRILNGLSFPQEGRYLFDGTQIDRKFLKNNANAKRFHKKIGVLFQNPDIMLFNAKVYDEIAFGPRQMGLDDPEVETIVKDCMDLFGIADLSDKAPYHLSGGQKKRVALAAVMALNPEVLILDEPYAGLDQKGREWLTGFLAELKAAGKTLIIATHQREMTASFADKYLDLNQK